MFIDDIKVELRAGRGGDGMVAFRREKYVPMGGPYGGNGGRGGDIIFVGEEGKSTLLHLRYNKIIVAKDGENGMSKNMFGKDAEDIYIQVPLGTVIHNADDDKIIGEILDHGQEIIVAKGGRGGRGNSSFATSRTPAPDFCEKGFPGDNIHIRVELKVLADVGFVGFPSVGKSTLISVISKARPKIAAYHFTTLSPNLGFVDVGDGRSFVAADLPGLIEGASSGAGLGFMFLRHIERTRVIVHIIDMSATDGRNPITDYQAINDELRLYNENLMNRPQVVVANKMDVADAIKHLQEFQKAYPDVDIIPISAYTRHNIQTLLYKIMDTLETIPLEFFHEEPTEEVIEYDFTPQEEKFQINIDDDGVYHVSGKVVERYFNMTDFTKDTNVKMFAQRLRRLGVDDKLRELGVKHGDTVRVLDFEFEFFD